MEIEINGKFFSEIWKKFATWFKESHPIVKSIVAAAILVKAILLVIFIIWLIGQGPMWLKIGSGGLVVFAFIVFFLYIEIFD